ncbi:RND family efflux transporter, MFP subunit [Natronincola peptidivorans]|uniref:RND family efflux transporter, MFP subunit n=1 Tax=Natronincola peptidivorans TaxID=426128 RepID=A0A1H9ZXS7_9FIRM|nr:efflux RND transporter periplasmic adaptor subunit [Natronincola peptidivorans]SES86532.1 RND family efflux transporter, MFP subunit [Natronincola peptidivorans]
MAKGKGKGKKKKIIIGVIIVVIAIAAIGANAIMRGNNEGLAVDVMALEKGEITITVPANGILEEIERQTIYAENSAKVLSIEVEEGDYVAAGQVLALLDGEDLEIQMAIKKQMLEMNKIDLARLEKNQKIEQGNRNRQMDSSLKRMEDAKTDLDRNKQLFEHGAISQQDFRNSERDYEEAVNSYEELQQKQDTLEFEIQKMRKTIAITELEIAEIEKRIEKQEGKIVSSINGVVTNIHVEEGSFVNTANPSFVIANIEDLTIEINVNEYDIAKVEVGQKVEIQTDALMGQVFKGEVEKIAPVAKRVSTGQTNETVIPVTIKVIERDDFLKPGFSVRTRIISQKKEDVLVVPFDSIMVEQNGAKMVFVVREDTLHKIEVQTGIESDFDVEIIRGLEENDMVVLNPSMFLTEGMKVTVNERQQEEK